MAVTQNRTQEQRVRRMAERQGLELRKSRRRDPLALDYGRWWVVSPDIDPQPNDPAFSFQGHGRPARHFPWNGVESLDEVEDFLRTPPQDRS
jgi:hypothetical protein